MGIKEVEEIDEFGNVRKVLKEVEEEDRYYSKPAKRTVIKEVEEIDEFGNVRKVLKEVEEDGIKKAPKSRNLKEKIIIDKHGNKKKVLLDDEGNVVDEDDVEYEDEDYIDENGNRRTRKVAKIKKDAMKRMQEREDEDEDLY